MNDLKERFKAFASEHFYLQEIPQDFDDSEDEFVDAELQTAWEAFKAGAGVSDE